MNEVTTQTEKIESVREKERCDIDIVLETEENINNISDELIYLFLYTFDENCKNNIEFGEYSNEVLFKLLEQHPKRVVENITKEGINLDVILNELANPISDVVNVDDVLKSINTISTEEGIKNKLVDALRRNK
ncbi:hypothetical protein EYV94_21525 [Puteibacter caeruleilacunae]|nr:hypothetical protein EYV94_21525 [Puteibacter caeruleilacunae]